MRFGLAMVISVIGFIGFILIGSTISIQGYPDFGFVALILSGVWFFSWMIYALRVYRRSIL